MKNEDAKLSGSDDFWNSAGFEDPSCRELELDHLQ
jgi:hypothetical protein